MFLDSFKEDIRSVFGVELSKDVSKTFRTAGCVYDWLQNEVPMKDRTHASYEAQVTNTLLKEFNGNGNSKTLKPDCELKDLVPIRNRRRFWSALAERTKLVLPDLQRPVGLVWASIVGVIIGAIYIAHFLQPIGAAFVIAAFGVSVVLLGIFASMITRPWQTQFGPETADIENLVQSIVVKNATKLKSQGCQWTRIEAWKSLQRLVTIHYCESKEEVTRDFDFFDY